MAPSQEKLIFRLRIIKVVKPYLIADLKDRLSCDETNVQCIARNPVFEGFQPDHTQNGLLSYKD